VTRSRRDVSPRRRDGCGRAWDRR